MTLVWSVGQQMTNQKFRVISHHILIRNEACKKRTIFKSITCSSISARPNTESLGWYTREKSMQLNTWGLGNIPGDIPANTPGSNKSSRQWQRKAANWCQRINNSNRWKKTVNRTIHWKTEERPIDVHYKVVEKSSRDTMFMQTVNGKNRAGVKPRTFRLEGECAD